MWKDCLEQKYWLVCYETLKKIVHAGLLACLSFGPHCTNLIWTVSIEYIAHLVPLIQETSDTRTVLLMLFDIGTIRVIPSLTDSHISLSPHITTLLNDTFVGFLFCWVLRVISRRCVNLTQRYDQLYRWMLSGIFSWSFRMLYSLRTCWMLQLSQIQKQRTISTIRK